MMKAKKIIQSILFVLLFHLPFIANGQGLDVEFFHPKLNVLTFRITNITDYKIIIWCGLEADGSSEIRFDKVINKRDTIRDLYYELYPEVEKYTIFLSPRQTYTKTYNYANYNFEFIKAKVLLKYHIDSTPSKSIFMEVRFDTKYREL